jgi:hypothetical protein
MTNDGRRRTNDGGRTTDDERFRPSSFVISLPGATQSNDAPMAAQRTDGCVTRISLVVIHNHV